MTPSGAASSGAAGASRPHASASAAVRLRESKAVEPSHVLPDDLPPLFLRDSLEVALDDLPRMRPGRHGVRIVRGAHDVLDHDELAVRDAHVIVVDGCEDVTPEVLDGSVHMMCSMDIVIV